MRGIEVIDPGDELRELIDQLAHPDDQRPDAGADQGPAQEHQRGGEAAHGQGRRRHARHPAPGHDGRERCSIGRQPSKVADQPVDGRAKDATVRGQSDEGIGQRLDGRGYGDGDAVTKAIEDQRHSAECELRAAQGFEGITVQNRAKIGGLVAKSGHLRPAVPQKRQKAGGIRGHGLEIEGHLLLAETSSFQCVDVKLQCLRPRQSRELVSRHTHARGDILEEVRHRPAAGLEEIPDPVVHVLQDIGQLLLFDARRADAAGVRGRGHRGAA